MSYPVGVQSPRTVVQRPSDACRTSSSRQEHAAVDVPLNNGSPKLNAPSVNELRDVEQRVRSTSEPTGAARIEITDHGPYRVRGDVVIFDAEGNLLRDGGTWCLCRCGGSRNKPFCDATHGLKGFDGAESADHGSIVDRRDRYVAEGIIVFDDRSRCAHFGQCTDRLPAVFRAATEPFVDPHNAAPDSIADVVAGCPSGALA